MINQELLLVTTSKVLLDSLSEEDKNKLLSDALTKVLTPVKKDRYSYGSEQSPLEEAFETAAVHAGREMVREYFQLPEVREKVRTLIQAAMEKMFVNEQFIEEMALRMTRNMWKE